MRVPCCVYIPKAIFFFFLLSSVNPVEVDIQRFSSERTYVPRSGNNEAVCKAVYR